MSMGPTLQSTESTTVGEALHETLPEEKNYTEETKDGKFPVIEIFGPTIQGEGAMIGVRTMFVRMGGCDYRCERCDSMHAVHPMAVKANAKWMTEEEIVTEVCAQAAASSTTWVTLSGGNPAMWNFTRLIQLFQGMNMKVALETQGSIYRGWIANCDQVTVSPKGPGMGERFNPEVFKSFILNYYNQKPWDIPNDRLAVKVVVFDQQDFEFAVQVNELLRPLIHQPKKFLSLGNSYQPVLEADMQLHDPKVVDSSDEGPIYTWSRKAFSLPQALLDDYKVLLEDYLQDSRLEGWVFLPQLHVLVWSNKSGV